VEPFAIVLISPRCDLLSGIDQVPKLVGIQTFIPANADVLWLAPRDLRSAARTTMEICHRHGDLARRNVSLPAKQMNEDTIRKAMRLLAARGGIATPKRMTAAQRKARAKKAAAASAKVRTAKARAKRKEGK